MPQQFTNSEVLFDRRIAIVGIGCRFPGGIHDVESFWDLLINARSAIVEVPPNRWARERYYHRNAAVAGRMATKWGGFVDNLDKFDAGFWGISPREAMRMDPQQRWLLEVAWEALEDAGTPPAKLRGASIGVFVGISSNDYGSLQLSDYPRIDVHTNSGGTLSIAANRISYLLDFKGPSLAVDTACSSSLVAVHSACQSILSGECEGALAGGVNALITPHASVGFSKAAMLSPSGRCFAFDKRADGYVRGEGAGLLYLKPLSRAIENHDPVYAVIRASVINQDGHTSSMTVPSVESQSAMLRQAYRVARIEPSRVAYMEAHGTGTQVGDPIEATALGNVLSAGRAPGKSCLIGSVKTNIGHLESASGAAGLIKAALVLQREVVPPNLNFATPNPNIPFDRLQLSVPTKLHPLPRENGALPVTAVNSFGFGGANAHVVLEAAPEREPLVRDMGNAADRPFMLPVSARHDESLQDYAKAYRKFLGNDAIGLADICYSAGACKEQHEHRLAVVGQSHQQLRDRLDAWIRETDETDGIVQGRRRGAAGPLVFVFTGQGTQWWAMGQQLLTREPSFRRTIEQIDELLISLAGWSLQEEMAKPEGESKIDRTAVAQPAIFAVQVALAGLWESWGIVPGKVMGHSVGEVAAAYCAGIYSLEDAVNIVYQRSRLQDKTGGSGRMLAAGITAQAARRVIGDHADRVQLAAINSSDLVTLAGDTEPLEQIGSELEDAGRFVRWLRVNYAFHTHQMEPIKKELTESLTGIRPQPGQLPFISTLTGGVMPGEKMDASYWWRNVRNPVLFSLAASNLIAAGHDLFLEVGPHPALQSSINQCLAEQNVSGAVFHSLRQGTDESSELLSNLAGLYTAGVELDWLAVNQSTGNFVRLPSYPWRYESCWLDEGEMADRLLQEPHPFLGKRVAGPMPTWQFELDPRRFSYLEDHRFWDGIIFPAAGFAEIGLALARELYPDDRYVVEDIESTNALFVSVDRVPTVQVVFDEESKSFNIHSTTGKSQDWTLNARGRIVLISADPPAPACVPVDTLRDGLSDHIGHDRYYAEFAAIGYQFGFDFSQIQGVWRQQGESLVEIVVPESVLDSTPDYHFHPAVLDACFQASRGVQIVPEDANPQDFFYLPESIRRFQVYREKPPAHLWAHARLLADDGKSIVTDILVYDDDGGRVADILGFRVTQVEQSRAGDELDQCLYQFRWEPCPLSESLLAEHGLADTQAFSSDHHDADSPGHESAEPAHTVSTRPVTGVTTGQPPAEQNGEAEGLSQDHVAACDGGDSKIHIVLADEGGVAASLISKLQQRGHGVISIRAGSSFRQESETEFVVAPNSQDDLKKVLACETLDRESLSTWIHCWSLDNPRGDQLSLDGLLAAQSAGVLSALQLTHVLTTENSPSTPRVYFLTRDVESVVNGDGNTGIASSPLVGLARVANNEHFPFRWTIIDLDRAGKQQETDDLVAEMLLDDDELEIAYRNARRFVRRLVRVRAGELPQLRCNAVQTDSTAKTARGNGQLVVPYRLEIEKPGVLSHLALNETRRREPGPDEIEVQVRACGINFRDIMKALGMYPGNPIDLLWFGDDFAGVVVRVGANVTQLQPGDKVAGMAPYCFRSYVTVDRHMVFKKPAGMAFEDAATLPTVFLTSHYAINHLARMQPGEAILIHAGTGGVGQAAIQIAQRLGLEIFATAGTPAKRQLLRDAGVPHVLNSRTLEFADEIREISGGRGVDAVLNSLAGEFIPKSLSVLAPFGRFLEIGKIDIYRNSRIGLQNLKDNISYFVIDLAQQLEQRAAAVASMFGELAQRFESGDYQPLTRTVFPIGDVVEAFRFMAQGKHVGKNVLSLQQDEIPIGPCTEEGHLFRGEATYLITGGAGGFGLETAKWMARQGARHLVLLSRSGPQEGASADINQLRAEGIVVLDSRGDVTDKAAVQRIIDNVQREMPPLQGVVHAAMVLDDAFLGELDEERFNRALHPKMLGAWNLHLATRNIPLEHFICFSSFSTVTGGAKQANYNAGNYFLDTLASHRRALGLPALTVNWGALTGAGFVERNKKTAEYLDLIGLKPFTTDEALRILGKLILRDPVDIAASRVDWSALSRLSPALKRSNTYAPVSQERTQNQAGVSLKQRVLAAPAEESVNEVADFIASQVAGVFGIDVSEVDRQSPLTNLGLDSLMAVELMNRVEAESGLSIPMGSVLSGPNVEQLAQVLLKMLTESEGDATSDGAVSVGPTRAVPLLEKAEYELAEFPLSLGQRAVWSQCFDRRRPDDSDPGANGNVAAAANGSAGHQSCCVMIETQLDIETMRQAFSALLLCHPILDVTFSERNGEPMQRLRRRGPVTFHVHEATHLSLPELHLRLAQQRDKPLDPERGPVVRLEIFRAHDNRDALVLSLHALVGDAWSVVLLLGELLDNYAAGKEGQPLPERLLEFSFQDFVEWERKQLEGEAGRRSLDYWKEQLTGAPIDIQLPTKRPPLAARTNNVSSLGFRLDDELTHQLIALGAEQRVTLEVTLLSIFKLLLHSYTQQDDILVGFPLPGRGPKSLLRMPGRFVNPMPLRSCLEGDPLFPDFQEQTSRQLLGALLHQHLPWSRLTDVLSVPPGVTGRPVYQVSFTGQNFPAAQDQELALLLLGQGGHQIRRAGLSIESVDLSSIEGSLQEPLSDIESRQREPCSSPDLNLAVGEASGQIIGRWHFNDDLFDADTIVRINSAYTEMLTEAVRNPLRAISQLVPPTVREQARTSTSSNDSSVRRLLPRDSALQPDVDFEAEAKLDPTITPVDSDAAATNPRRALLTGGTGFLGAFLMDALLERTDLEIVCLVRADSRPQAMQRVIDNLAKYNIRPAGALARVSTVVGDLSKPLLGLTGQEFARLSRDIDVIYHNGAVVNLVMPYSSLRSANVLGAQEVLRLACQTKVKPTHLVSTFTVHATAHNRGQDVTETDPLPPCEALLHGYSQTKWVVERLAEEARERGLPVAVYRPGHITGDSRTGASNTGDLLHTMVLVCWKLGVAPLRDVVFVVTPVDYVAQALVELSRRPESLGRAFHLTNPEPLQTWEFAEWIQRSELGVTTAPYEQWRAQLLQLAEHAQADAIRPLAEILAPRVLAADDQEATGVPPRFDCRATQSALRGTNVRCPPADPALFSVYLEYLRMAGAEEFAAAE